MLLLLFLQFYFALAYTHTHIYTDRYISKMVALYVDRVFTQSVRDTRLLGSKIQREITAVKVSQCGRINSRQIYQIMQGLINKRKTLKATFVLN